MPSTPTAAGMVSPHPRSVMLSPVASNGIIAGFPVDRSLSVASHGSSGSLAIPSQIDGLFVFTEDIGKLYSFPEGGLRGAGGFGRVVVANRPDGTCCALKIVGKQHGRRSEIVRETVRREVTALRCVSHPSIVPLYAAVEAPTAYYLEFELCNQDAFAFMQLGSKTHRILTERDVSLIVQQLASALAVLHHNGLAHLDVKLENVLINSPSDVRLADFGFARQVPRGSTIAITNESGLYTPPEVLRCVLSGASVEFDSVEAKAMDMWCLGVVTCLLLSGRPPYRNRVSSRADREDMLRKISNGLAFAEERWGSVGLSARDFVAQLLAESPCDRITALRALSHPFLSWKPTTDEGACAPPGPAAGPEEGSVGGGTSYCIRAGPAP